MSGHSKWKNIAHRKEKTDAQRAKLFTKLSREITVSVREGGADPASNPRLKDCMAKARAGNVPQENIKRVIERAAGGGGGDYESVRYEGYGPGGVAVIVDAMTDNRHRTASEVRHNFDKYGGKLGAAGCVGWCFSSKGVMIAECGDLGEDDVLLLSLQAGASDVQTYDGVYEITCAPESFSMCRDALQADGFAFLSASVELVPENLVKLTGEEDIKLMRKLLTAMDDSDDVQDVWHNWSADEPD
ncbi:MAG: YebC/PmpR family DNA-binding transcriptional regulator [Oscillospiraceae bacterium]|nr:YebC/PmpR family DNA-binding transcriptional regulator [Oscillospiraceae bacterium]